jgi:hypothetical protein
LKISNKGNTILLRGKYIVVEREINATWECFDQSNFYISRINIIEWNNKHLLHAGEGNMEIYSPKSIIFPELNAWVNAFSHFLNPML